MNSLGSSSKWPSYDSLPSTPSFFHSESEQTEDEAEVFSDGEGDGGLKGSLAAADGITHSGSFISFPTHPEELRSRSDLCPDQSQPRDPGFSPGAAALRSPSATPGDLAFAQKCADLHRFIHPLVELLRGLKIGKFDRGLNTFQSSVAIDRLQRIIGVLQKPEMGEKYLQNLLQIEMLLRIWFPHEAFKSADTPKQTTCSTYTRQWHQNQLHMPVKKRKLSWSNYDDGRLPTKHNHHRPAKRERSQAPTSFDTVSTCLPLLPTKQTSAETHPAEPAGDGCAPGYRFTDRTVLFSTSPYSRSRRENKNLKPSEISLCGSPAMQDCSVSSSNAGSVTHSP
ncbi:circadian associated repressor of transcription a [Cololabis saira]|uniref:circadian associated repressor of transcription a n=1 Tax=Cololabis saira TaxID=129043 RepID=UPI002AD2E22F|nr:circadian associated repressor of transcription a [Cololabis saira]